MSESIKKFLKCFIVSIVISLFLEVFIFNYNHFVSKFYPKENAVEFYQMPNGLEYQVENDKTYYKYIVNINNIDRKIYNLYIDVQGNADIDLYLTDEANKKLYNANSHHLSSVVKKSNYIKLNTSGKSNSAQLDIITDEKDFNVKSISVNKEVPLFFNVLRFVSCFLIVISIMCFKKFSLLDGHFEEYKYKYVLLGLLVSIILGMYVFINMSSRGNFNVNDMSKLSEHHQYALLAQSLSKGKVTIDIPVSDKLLNLDNPYDQAYRDTYLTMNKDYYLDYAFYNGKYYSYFGVLPCIMLYLPYYLLTGHNLNTSFAILISCTFYLLSAFYLVYQLFKKYFPKASFKLYLLFSLMLSLCSGIAYIIRIGHFYGVPIAMGAAFAMLGLGFWLKSSLAENINGKYLCLGSISLALVAGCRPQMLVSSFLIVPIFWKQIREKEIFKIKNILLIAIPYIIIAALLMYYNYIRFGSVFDFGANYNLTSNDMRKRGFVLGRTGLGILNFIFSYPRITPIFPFFDYYKVTTAFHGVTICEELAGGILFMNLLSILNLFIFKFKKLFINKNSFYLALSCIIGGLIIVVADTQMAGIVPRYMCDFGFLFSISAIIIAMTILNDYKGNIQLVKKIFVYLIIISITLCFLIYFTDGLRAENNSYRDMYLYFYYLFMFWL